MYYSSSGEKKKKKERDKKNSDKETWKRQKVKGDKWSNIGKKGALTRHDPPEGQRIAITTPSKPFSSSLRVTYIFLTCFYPYSSSFDSHFFKPYHQSTPVPLLFDFIGVPYTENVPLYFHSFASCINHTLQPHSIPRYVFFYQSFLYTRSFASITRTLWPQSSSPSLVVLSNLS